MFGSTYFFSYLFGNNNPLCTAGKYFRKWLFFLPNTLAVVCTEFFVIITGITLVYCYVSGLYRIITFRFYLNKFESKTKGGVIVAGHLSYPNINRVLSYRESIMAGMSSERAAELYVQTASINMLYSGYTQGQETERTLSYIESKLSGMSGERALNYLSHKL